MRAFRIAVVLLLVLLLAACGGSGAGETADDSAEAGAGAADADESGVDVSTAKMSAGDDAAEDGGVGLAVEGGGADDAGDADIDPPEVEPLPAPPATGAGDRVIKEGTVSVEVETGEFDRAFLAVVAAARRHGGDVVGSSTRTGDNGDTFGSVTVRVPVANFEDLVVGMGDIGTIRSRDVDSQDVSAEFTDLESRLRHLQAQERFYLGLFDQADSVRDAIQVQQQLDGIQAAIEKIQGRKSFLEDRTSFSTLTVELFEPGAGGPLLAEQPPTDRPTLARYWDTARDAFVNVVGAMLVVVLSLLPLLVPAVVVLGLWLARRPRRTAPPPAAAREEDREPVGADSP